MWEWVVGSHAAVAGWPSFRFQEEKEVGFFFFFFCMCMWGNIFLSRLLLYVFSHLWCYDIVEAVIGALI